MTNSWKTKLAATAGMLVVTGLAIAGVDRGGVTLGVLGSSDRATTIVVNDVVFDATDATVIANGNLASLNHLAVGQVLAVYGDINEDGVSGQATSITYDAAVDGPIDWLDRHAGDGMLVVLGQRVRLDKDTVYAPSISPASIDGLQEGMHIEVSGFRSDTEIAATYVGLRQPGSRLDVTGIAQNVNTSNDTLTINDLELKYHRAEMVGFLDGQPVDGNVVNARGWTVTGSGKLRVDYLEKKPILSGEPGVAIQLDGLVSSFESLDAIFHIAGSPVTIADGTNFERGEADAISNGIRLRVAGHFDQDNLVVADLIEFYPSQ